ncbi:hypothetical protein LJR231_000305 [Phyllobacterium sp. LjRoot231]|uniref:hypothetical protein n=1 Tax=Phyllobacterium sp. LjRoot231 TaxID=3342289 RepID=UPI003ECCFC81
MKQVNCMKEFRLSPRVKVGVRQDPYGDPMPASELRALEERSSLLLAIGQSVATVFGYYKTCHRKTCQRHRCCKERESELRNYPDSALPPCIPWKDSSIFFVVTIQIMRWVNGGQSVTYTEDGSFQCDGKVISRKT